MRKLFVLLADDTGSGTDGLEARYVHGHLPKVEQLPGVESVTGNLVREVPETFTPMSGFGTPGTGVDAVDEVYGGNLAAAFDHYPSGLSIVAAYLVEERWLHRGIDAARSRFKRIALLRRADHLELDGFVNYWRDVHGPLALEVHAFSEYRQNDVLATLAGDADWDGVVQMRFLDDEDFLRGFFPDEHARERVLADVPRFIGGWDRARPAWSLDERYANGARRA